MQAKTKNSEEKILQTLEKILADQPLNEDDKGYITRVKEIINYQEELKAMCIPGDKYLLKSDLNVLESDIVSDLELPREIIVMHTENVDNGVMCICACKCGDGWCTRKIQQETIDLVYKRQ